MSGALEKSTAAASGKTIEFHTVDVDGTRVNFPFEPYDLQIAYMKKVLECVRGAKNGLLESPTGTGKTLSLLCSSLAWLEEAKAAKQLARVQAAAVLDQASADIASMLTTRNKIIYSSRTHSQLSQAMSELAGTTYRYMRVSILGSRDQLCVNPAVMEAPSSRDKINMCQARVKAKTCTYHQNVEKHKERQEFRDGQLMDIEDLHKMGKKHNFCPYYMSKELYQTADVIFLPYNYLLDAKTRKTLDIDLNESVIIFDEAHNIQKLCEEAASVSINLSDIAQAIQDIDWISEGLAEQPKQFDERADLGGAANDINESEMLAIKGFLLDIETGLTSLMSKEKQITRTGSFISEVFQHFQFQNVQHTMDLMINYTTAKNEGGISTKGRGLSKLWDLITTAFNSSVTSEDLEKLYKVHIVKEEKSDNGKGFLKSRSETIVLNLWCFSPGFSMRNLSKLGARSIILTSGTLSPLSAFEEEIGIPFPVQLENKHIISASQVWCGAVTNGPDGTLLNSSFKCRSDVKYLASLGQSIINIIRVVPHGVLIFFPSYSLMNSTREYWQGAGLWTKMEAVKPLFLEPQRKDALATVMREYYTAAKDRKGACFLAVCRGKVAEGLDFADDNGRACIITGLPYPPFKDARVELKRQFLDDELKKSKRSASTSMTGQKWYGLEAYRATNQAIGRVIRHSRDHGAIIFLDNRFCEGAARQNLSGWLQPFFHKHAQIGTAIKGLASFFKTDSMIGKQRQNVIAEQTALINKNNASKKRKRVEPQFEMEEENGKRSLDLDMYKGGRMGGEGNRAPRNIYEESSAGIGFNSQIKSDNSSSFLRPTPPSAFSSAKPGVKKKLKIVRGMPKAADTVLDTISASAANGSSGGGSSADAPSASTKVGSTESNSDGKGTQDLARNYVALLKKTVTTSEFNIFKSAIKYYKQEGNLKDVTSALDTILIKYLESRPQLLTGFKVFIKKHHAEEFDKFCEKAMMSAHEVTQIPVRD